MKCTDHHSLKGCKKGSEGAFTGSCWFIECFEEAADDAVSVSNLSYSRNTKPFSSAVTVQKKLSKPEFGESG